LNLNGLPIPVCTRCGHAVFPARALCPRCGARDWRVEPAATGVVEETTTRRAGGSVASVRTELGPVVVARSPDDAPPGAVVALSLDGGAPVVRRDNRDPGDDAEGAR
jgi:hypothetical protein